MNWTFYPKNKMITDDLYEVVKAFENNLCSISSDTHDLVSNDVLAAVTQDLQSLGFTVETSKKSVDKIQVPVLFGENGRIEKYFDADAYQFDKKILIEVEAGRAVTNYQFLKDFFEACCMYDAEYLCIAVREIYKKRNDYLKVCDFFNALYAANRLSVPLKGVLIIGY